MEKNIILAGVGGQGILSIAYVIDNAALPWVLVAEGGGVPAEPAPAARLLEVADHGRGDPVDEAPEAGALGALGEVREPEEAVSGFVSGAGRHRPAPASPAAGVAWALGSPAWFLRNFSALPWNVPDRGNFAATRWQRAAIYVLKCIPIQRGGKRAEATRVLAAVAWLLRERARLGGKRVLVSLSGRGDKDLGIIETTAAHLGQRRPA